MRTNIALRHVAMPATFIAGHDIHGHSGRCQRCDRKCRDCQRLENIFQFPTPSVMAECIVGHTDQPSLFIEGFRLFVASPRVQDLLLGAKDLFGAAKKR
jgi:hypothetical protein